MSGLMAKIVRRRSVVSRIILSLLLFANLAMVLSGNQSKTSALSSRETAQADPIDWWPMFHHDPNHTGTSTGPNMNNTLWNYTTGAGVFSSPAVAVGCVFVGSWDGNVYCLNASTGALVWSYKTGGSVVSSPAVASGYLFVGSGDGKIYAFGIGTIVPEFPSSVVLPLLMVATLLAAIVCRRRVFGRQQVKSQSG